jgi:L-malate glycosyltransferase
LMLLRDDALHQNFSQAGLDRVKQEFCGLKIADQYEQLYAKVLSR